MRLTLWFLTVFVFLVGYASLSYAEWPMNKMAKICMDESHCLDAPEIRDKKDWSISCSCRDAIMNARYLSQNYLDKDSNLSGAVLGLVDNAERICSERFDVILQAIMDESWQWEGPQVEREYPPESDILKIKVNNKGFRTVKYRVHLIYFDKGGRVTKVQNFNAIDEIPDFEAISKLHAKLKK